MTQPKPNAVASSNALRDLTTGSAGTLLLLVLVFVCYAWTVQSGYVWLDDAYVTANRTMHSFAGLSSIWTELGSTPQYYPLTFTTFWLESQAFGFKPQLSHAINIGLHAASALLLWKILRRLAVPGAWVAAAVFAIHPIQVESVAWITERKNTLSMILALSSVWMYLRFARLGVDDATAQPAGEGFGVALPDEPKRLYRLFLALFALALLAKTAVAVLPAILLVIIWWQRGRLTRADLLPLLPAFALAIVAVSVTTYVEHDPYLVGATGVTWHIGLLQRVVLVGQTIAFYAYKTLWPFPIGFSVANKAAIWPWLPINFNYERWTIDPASPLQWLPLVGVIAAVAALVALRRKLGRGPLAGVLVFLIGVLPASGLISFWPQRFAWVADHLAYVGSIGLIVGVVSSLAVVLGRLPRVAAGTAAVLMAGLVAVTFWHATAFRSSKTLWEETINQNPQSWLASINYGGVMLDRAGQSYLGYMKLGDEATALSERDKYTSAADLWFNAALKLNPNAYEAHTGLGVLAAQRGRRGEALAHYSQAVRITRDIGIVNDRTAELLAGELLLAEGRTTEALAVFTELEAIGPQLTRRSGALLAKVHTRHGDVLRQSIQSPVGPDMPDAASATLKDAMDHYDEATLASPDSVPPKVKLAAILIDINRPVEALQRLSEVLHLDPNNPDAKYLTALVAEKQGVYDAAAAQLANLLALHPDYLPAHLELAKVFRTLGRPADGITELTNTLQNFPNSEDVKRLLAEFKAQAATQPSATTLPAR